MELAIKLRRKLNKAKRMLSAGRYREFLCTLLDKVTLRTHREMLVRDVKYLYLKHKYKPFIAEYVNTHKVRRGGGYRNIIWWLWLQGVDEAPDICKACLASLRRWHSDKDIIVLDKTNLSQYVTLPDYINLKHERGIIDNTKYSNLIRLQLLIEHGGTWIDSTVLCTGRSSEYIMHSPLFMFHEPYLASVAGNWFISAYDHDPILTLVRDLHFEYWREYDYCIDYFVFHMFFNMAAEIYSDEWNAVPFFSSTPPHLMQGAMHDEYSEEKIRYLASQSDFHKLTYKIDDYPPSAASIYHHVASSYA